MWLKAGIAAGGIMENKMKTVRFWEFWNPQSGFIGGLIFAVVVGLPVQLLIIFILNILGY
ncbi:hypothetical protein EAE89_12395 [Photorhabdus heterorhabditis]|nr:hypothetical protein [Photorhabdus heterorhabditis]